MTLRIELWRERDMADALAVFRSLDYDPIMDEQWLKRLTVGDPTSPEGLRLVARQGQTLVAFAVGCVRGTQLVIKFIAVRPDQRRQGVATALLQTLEQTGRSLGLSRALAGGVGPGFFYPGVDLTLTPALSFFWRYGYQTDRVARVDMRVDLERTPLDVAAEVVRLEREGLVIRRIAREGLAAEIGRAHV